MKNKTDHNFASLGKNPNGNKLRIRSIISFVLIGMLIGIIPNFFGMNKIFRNKFENPKNSATVYCYGKHQNQSFELVNSLLLKPSLNQNYQKDMLILQSLVQEFCNEAKKDPSINDISFYFRDLTNERGIGVNENEKYIPASLAKVPIMIAAFQKAEKEPNYLTKKLEFKGSFTSRYLKAHPAIDDVRTVMVEGEFYSVDALINLMITKSDNEAAIMLYDDFGIENWNKLQTELGNSIPISAPLDKNILSVKNYSSFFRILFNSSLLSREYSEKALEILSRSEYSNGIRLAVPSTITVCHKYGERDSAINENAIQIKQLHHAGIVYFPGKTYFVGVMTKGSDKKKMQNVIYQISKITYEQVDKQLKESRKPSILFDIQ